MSAIGGLDVAFGARMQVVRTNVMCVAIADTGLANSTTVPKYILNTYKEALKGTVIEPDFLYLYEVADLDGSGFTTAAVSNSLFNQDNSGDGTADVTALEVNGVLRMISQCPLAVNSAYADTTAAHGAEGAAHTAHNYYDINGNLALESVLSLSAMALDDTAADQAATGVFSDNASADTNAMAGLFPQAIQALAFKDVYDNATASTGGNLDAASKYTGMHKGPFTVDLTTALQQLETGPAIATGAAAATLDAYTSSTTFATMAADMTGDAGIISMTSLAKVV
tara:strand:- start:1736 stop:2581 length:846 start_codon:yes stop_codon:yes gene_type:complete